MIIMTDDVTILMMLFYVLEHQQIFNDIERRTLILGPLLVKYTRTSSFIQRKFLLFNHVSTEHIQQEDKDRKSW